MPFPFIAAGLGLASIAGSIFGSKSQSDINKKNVSSQEQINRENIAAQREINQQNISFQEKQYQLSKQDSYERWQMENAYNSPEAQMARLKDAGLNPHLLYGNGSAATGTGSSLDSPQYNTPHLSAPQANPINHGVATNPIGNTATGVGQFLSAMLMQQQVEKTAAETRSIDVNTENNAIDLAVKKMVGLGSLERNLSMKMQSQNAQASQTIREYDSWVEAAFGTADPDAELSSDRLGTYAIKGSPILKSMSAQFENNALVNAARKAGIDNTIYNLQLLKKKAVLYDDQHALNQIQVEIQDFTKRLTDFGVSRETTGALAVIVGLLKTVFGK